MTKSELIAHVAQRLPYMTLKDAEIIVDTIFDSMADALAQGDCIQIRGFGSLKVKDRGEREGRNPKTGESVYIPAKKLPLFKIGKELHERVQSSPSAAQVSCPRRRGEAVHRVADSKVDKGGSNCFLSCPAMACTRIIGVSTGSSFQVGLRYGINE